MKSLQRFARSGLFGVLACFSTGQVFADAVITSATREVLADVGDGPQADSDVGTSGSFSASVSSISFSEASAVQDSSIGVSQFGGTGGAQILGSGAVSHSTYEVFFDLSVSHAYSLSGLLEESLNGGESTAVFELTGPGTNLLFGATGNAGALDLANAGFLGPGSYHLEVDAFSHGEESNDFVTTIWEFDLTLRVLQVPEPATLALLAIALAGFAFSRRKTLVVKRS